jgi:hypothetical protein
MISIALPNKETPNLSDSIKMDSRVILKVTGHMLKHRYKIARIYYKEQMTVR